MHHVNMIEGALIAKALTLEPNAYKDSADERESAQANENKGAL